MKVYINQCRPELAGLLGKDACTFAVLSRILKGTCAKTITDGVRTILCHSDKPYPVWIWTAEGMDEAEMSRIYAALETQFPPQEGYRYNVKHEFAQYMMRRGAYRIQVSMLSYRCGEAKTPTKSAPGRCIVAGEAQVKLAAEMMQAMHTECGVDALTPERALTEARGLIGTKHLFFWVDESGEPQAMCGLREDGKSAYISHVYTRPQARRQGFAANLVHALTRALLEKGFSPVLYTDADYAASNACYTGIGYEKVGELVTLAAT